MRLLIELSSQEERLKLPVQYNRLLQAMVYDSLETEFAEFLHNQGFDGGGRSFKLFTFSRLIGQYQLVGQEISFAPKVKLLISSPVDQFCQSLLNGLLTKGSIRLGQTGLNIDGIRVEKPEVLGAELKLKLLSPVVAYSTLFRADGSKYTCYYQPGDGEFTRVTAENLRKKYQAFHQNPAPEGEITMQPLRQPKLHVLEYKGNVIKGYSGTLLLKGPQELLQIALDAGLGSKNSMGFGCGEMG